MKTKYVHIAIVACILAIANIATAQSQIRFGAKAGIDVADHKISTDMLNVKNRLGFQLGGTMEFGVPLTGIGGELSLLYGHKEYKTEDKVADTDISDYNYISIPLVIKKRFGIVPMVGVFVSGGVFTEIRLSGGDLKVDEYIDDFKAKNFAFGLTAGAGVSLLSNVDLGLYYRATLTDRYSVDNPDWGKLNDKKYQTWTVGLTYFF